VIGPIGTTLSNLWLCVKQGQR